MSAVEAFDAAQHPIRARAELYRRIRQFMAEREITEVETPYLSFASNSDPNIQNLTCELNLSGTKQTRYLHTSPEFPMKRLLSRGVESIYQIARVFRDNERGKLHHPEFSMLEWYRLGFDHHQLMAEIDQFLNVFGLPNAIHQSYAEAFIQSELGIDPHRISLEELIHIAGHSGLVSSTNQPAMLLDFLFSKHVAPNLGNNQPYMIYDYPETQAALAKLRQQDDIKVAERFEVFINGMEIANGYHELNDAKELRQRFDHEQTLSQQSAIPTGPLDKPFIDSSNDLPDCAGVALGLDRLLMILLNKTEIDQVLCFPVESA